MLDVVIALAICGAVAVALTPSSKHTKQYTALQQGAKHNPQIYLQELKQAQELAPPPPLLAITSHSTANNNGIQAITHTTLNNNVSAQQEEVHTTGNNNANLLLAVPQPPLNNQMVPIHTQQQQPILARLQQQRGPFIAPFGNSILVQFLQSSLMSNVVTSVANVMAYRQQRQQQLLQQKQNTSSQQDHVKEK